MDTPNLARALIQCSQDPESRASEHSIDYNFRDYGPTPVFIIPDDAQLQGLFSRVKKTEIGAIFDHLRIETVHRQP